MKRILLTDLTKLTSRVRGRTISHVARTRERALSIHFTDGSALVIEADNDGIAATLNVDDVDTGLRDSDGRPTARQREYLDFIQKYMARFGVAPAESDIQDHFMVSAPSVHSMIKTLERRGFITRQRDFFGQVVARSIRIVDPI